MWIVQNPYVLLKERVTLIIIGNKHEIKMFELLSHLCCCCHLPEKIVVLFFFFFACKKQITMLWDRFSTVISMVNLFYSCKRKKNGGQACEHWNFSLKCLCQKSIFKNNLFFFSISSDLAFPPLGQTDNLIERGNMVHVLQSIELQDKIKRRITLSAWLHSFSLASVKSFEGYR